MNVDKDAIREIVKGTKVSELISESKDKLIENVVTGTQNLVSQIKACAKANDLEGIKVLLSAESQEDETSEMENVTEPQEDETSENVSEDESKVELSKEKSELNAIRSELESLDGDINTSISDRQVVRTLGGKIQSLIDRTNQLL